MKTSYEILGIEKNATIEEIKIKYKQLAKKYHPDINDDLNAQTQFIEIKKAYEELSNPKIEDFLGFEGFGRIFGLEMWESLVKYEDFNLDRQTSILGKYLDLDNKDEENYKKYRWAKNKIKLLSKIYMRFSMDYDREGVNIQKIIKYLERVLNDDIDIKEKIQKPAILNEPRIFDYNHMDKRRARKIEYDIQNQFHPKFLNKFPMKVQIFIKNKIRDLLLKLENKT